MDALVVNGTITIPAAELGFAAVRSSGPGGQNVNKVASKVELRFDLARTKVLDDETRRRMRTLAAGHLDGMGRVIVVSQRSRSQERNLEDAREKLKRMILRALERPKPRKPTRPTASSRRKRVEGKRRHSEKKQSRRKPVE